jgi:hypothetical protein
VKFGKTKQTTWFESKRMLNIVIELEVWMKKAKHLYFFMTKGVNFNIGG